MTRSSRLIARARIARAAGASSRHTQARARSSPDRGRAIRSVSLAFAVFVLTAAVGAASASASLYSSVRTFGSRGTGSGQLQGPAGVAIQQTSGNVYVADAGNARVDEFGPTGTFIRAFGWGVADGKAKAEVCTSSCRAGIPGSGPGQFSRPTTIAVEGITQGAFAGKVFVGDQGNNVVEEFGASGSFVAMINGTSTPQGHFKSLAGVAVDQAGNLWTADGNTDNIDEFNNHGKFVQQWTDTHGTPQAIAVDSTNNAVYLTTVTVTERWTLAGKPQGEIDRPVFFGSANFGGPSASAQALDPSTGNLYVDHRFDSEDAVTVYDRTGVPLDSVSLGSNNGSSGVAFGSLIGGSGKAGQHDLYVSDANGDTVTIYGPKTTAGSPLITAESSTQTGKTTATVAAGIVPLGHDTSCKFQYVDYASFNANGFGNATTVPCTPADLGSGFGYRAASANVSGLTLGTVYHFRVLATSSAGTTTGTDQEFQAGPGGWAPFNRCPVDDPAMLANPRVTLGTGCVASNSTHGSIKIGSTTEPTGDTNLQLGLVTNGGIVAPADGAIVSDPVQIPNTPVGTVTAVTTSAGTPSNFSFAGGLSTGTPILTLPIKIQLQNPILGDGCFLGSDQDPILLHPANTDLSNAITVGGLGPGARFDAATGAPDVAGPDSAGLFTGEVQGDSTFAVPGATGCGPNGSLDAAVDAVLGVPSPSGNNQLVLDDASSALGFSATGENGQQFAADWHSAFG